VIARSTRARFKAPNGIQPRSRGGLECSICRRPVLPRPSMVIASVSRALRESVRRRREDRKLKHAGRIPCDARLLGPSVTHAELDLLFRSQAIAKEWRAVEGRSPMRITDKAGGVNPGDRRATYYLIQHVNPRTVLEIGTHIGASTIHIAAALRRAESEEGGTASRHLTTVDIVDMNARENAVWLEYGSKYSPIEMARRLGVDANITFATRGSLEYFAICRERYDFIFLDGDHTARTVYGDTCCSETSAAMCAA
jgi:predicted O-methyltransferase YrrM